MYIYTLIKLRKTGQKTYSGTQFPAQLSTCNCRGGHATASALESLLWDSQSRTQHVESQKTSYTTMKRCTFVCYYYKIGYFCACL